VIGVVDQIATDGSADQSSGVGFAVPSDLVAAIAAREPGETVSLEVERDGQKTALKVTLGTQPAQTGE
jgi:S1-C subfamily serine protease